MESSLKQRLQDRVVRGIVPVLCAAILLTQISMPQLGMAQDCYGPGCGGGGDDGGNNNTTAIVVGVAAVGGIAAVIANQTRGGGSSGKTPEATPSPLLTPGVPETLPTPTPVPETTTPPVQPEPRPEPQTPTPTPTPTPAPQPTPNLTPWLNAFKVAENRFYTQRPPNPGRYSPRTKKIEPIKSRTQFARERLAIRQSHLVKAREILSMMKNSNPNFEGRAALEQSLAKMEQTYNTEAAKLNNVR